MTDLDGEWDCIVKTPMGEQKALVTLKSDGGESFTGTYAGPSGITDITDGELMGQSVTFKMKFTSPIPVGIKADAVLSGDVIEGGASAGVFGRFPLRATRRT